MKMRTLDLSTRNQLRLPESNGHPSAPPPREPPPEEPLEEPFGFASLVLPTPALVVGLGTAGTRAARRFGRRLRQEYGRIPAGVVSYLGVDADYPPPGEMNFVHIGVDGAGTNPVKGRELFGRFRDTVEDALTSSLIRFLQGEPGLSAMKSATEVTTVSVIGGCGGCGGGGVDPMIGLVHEVRRRLGIRECRVQVFQIGPNVAVNDVDHSVTDRQEELILSTYAQNLHRLYTSFWNDDEDIFSLTLLDQANAALTLPTTNDLTDMMGDLLFLLHCTPIGLHYAARFCDHRGCLGHNGANVG